MTIGGRHHCCYSSIYRVENWDPKREGGGVRIQTQAGPWVCVSNHCPILLLVELPHGIMNSIILQYKKNGCCLGGVSKPHQEASQRHVAPKNSPEGCGVCLIEGGGRYLPVVKLHKQRYWKWVGMGHDATLMGLLLIMMAHITLKRRSLMRLPPDF